MTAYKQLRSALAAAAAALATLCLPTTSQAAVTDLGRTFELFGNCSDCVLNSPPGSPLAVLTLGFDYTLGSTLTVADIVSFVYVGSNLVFPMAVTGGAGVPEGSLPDIYEASGAIDATPGHKEFRISFGDGQAFATTAAGQWYVCGTGNSGPYSGSCNLAQNLDVGQANWNQPVPEPGTYGLMALGLAGLALVRRRKA
jgi:hypothetical protein